MRHQLPKNLFLGRKPFVADPKGRDILHQASKEVGLPNDAYFVAASAADYAAYRRFYQNAPASLH